MPTLDSPFTFWFLFGALAVVTILVLGLLVEVRALRRAVKITGADAAMRAIDAQRAVVEQLLARAQTAEQTLARHSDALAACLQRVGLVRYDAFQDISGKLSFSVALLDARHDGVIITILNGRDGARGYAKAVVNGESTVTLSEEEVQALAQARGR